MIKPRTNKGIFYFQTYRAARSYAEKHSWPTDRIIGYGLGWAIQLYISGPYVGPKTIYAELSTGAYNPDAYR